MTTYLLRLFSLLPPRLVAIFIAGISVLSLAAAFISQFGFGLKPCDLCLIQRVPFALNAGLGLIGMACLGWTRTVIGLSGLFFLINSGVAFYHSGVERHWWKGFSGCSTPDMSGSIEDLMARIQSTDVTRCDEIPWDLFGLSMANYNVMMCLGLGVACFIYLYSTRDKKLQEDTITGQ
ncbi:MAG: disulfide bond formation protein B [Alphaproteobacteria bacterium]|nr:disulfide bond formation protein B [Alphaproteobacteria bacterium]